MDDTRTLVVVFLRGGIDALSAVVPWTEEPYHRARPTLGIGEPRRDAPGAPIRLDDAFALHPALAALRGPWDDGRLAIVHAIGSDDRTRSHFEAMDQIERGASADASAGGGWIARWLRAANETGAFSAIAFGAQLAESLRGAPSACAVESLGELSVATRTGDAAGFAAALAALHAGDGAGPTALVRKGARDALRLLDRVEDLRREARHELSGVPDSPLGRALAQIVQIVRADVGLRAATVDHDGFDTHVGQAALLPDRLRRLGAALAWFDEALGDRRDRVTTLCVSEFGRRLAENSALGTDHGRGGVAFALGGGVRGGRVLGTWPGLAEDRLEDGLDLRVTTDYRDLLWEAVSRRFGALDCAAVFPGHVPRAVGAVA